jgi:carboxypeptidase D
MQLLTSVLLSLLILGAESRKLRPYERLRGPKEYINQAAASHENFKPPIAPRAPPNHPTSFYTPVFANANASSFAVNSTALPLVTFPLQPSWAGRLPISNSSTESRELFFWYWPSSASTASDTLTIWLNGGPGCSSLEGVLEENGPLSWQPGTSGIVPNSNAWTTQSDVVCMGNC